MNNGNNSFSRINIVTINMMSTLYYGVVGFRAQKKKFFVFSKMCKKMNTRFQCCVNTEWPLRIGGQ